MGAVANKALAQCGLELDRWIRPGQTVELEIDGIGTLANTIEADA